MTRTKNPTNFSGGGINKKMYAIKLEEGKPYKLYGNNYRVLISRNDTDRLESELVEMKKGCKTPLHSHDDLEQLYYVLKGEAIISIDNEEKSVTEGMIVYVPLGAKHRVSAVTDFKYFYVSVWKNEVAKTRTETELRAYEKMLVEGDR